MGISSRTSSKHDSRRGNIVTLFEWIGKVKCKKVEMRRKRPQDHLRVMAILTTALQRAECDMERQRQKRAHKWAEMNFALQQEAARRDDEDVERYNQVVNDLWNGELSELDKFFNNLSNVKSAIVR